MEATAFAISGANTTTKWDPNLTSAPAMTASSPISLTTTNANDFLFYGSRDGGSGVVQSGFTPLPAVIPGFLVCGYKKVTATQSGLSIADAAGSNGMVADAVIST